MMGSWPRRRRSRSFGCALRAHAFTRCSKLLRLLAWRRVERASARADRFSFNRTMRNGPAERLGERHPYPVSCLSAGPDAMVVGVVFAGWPSVAMVPILLKRAGRDKLQDRVR